MYALFRVAIMTNKLYSMYFKMGQSMPNGAMLSAVDLLLTLITLSFELLNLQQNSENLICSLKLPR